MLMGYDLYMHSQCCLRVCHFLNRLTFHAWRTLTTRSVDPAQLVGSRDIRVRHRGSTVLLDEDLTMY